MYRTFIDYDDEFHFYHGVLQRYNKTAVLEIGCGTGNLAEKFHRHGLGYVGLDLSDSMLEIARKKNPQCCFRQGDMRSFTLPDHSDAAIITGRTLSYLITNDDVRTTFETIHKHLPAKGIVCFDFIDASRFIPSITPYQDITHRATSGLVHYRRDSRWTPNHSGNWNFDWHSTYFRSEADGNWREIGTDESTLRAFTRDDMSLFLTIAGFNVVEVLDRRSYAFDTLVFIAEKPA